MAWVRNRKKRERDETIPVMFREKLVKQNLPGGKEAKKKQGRCSGKILHILQVDKREAA